MSQFWQGFTDGSLPPDVATTYTSDSGNSATPLAHILLVSADDTITNNNNGLRTIAGTTDGLSSNEVQIQITNRLQGVASITGAITGDIITFPLSNTSSVYRFDFLVTGKDVATGDGVGYNVSASARTDGASSAIISIPDIDADEDISLLTAEIDFIASGNNVILRATGVAGQTISYNAVGYYVVI